MRRNALRALVVVCLVAGAAICGPSSNAAVSATSVDGGVDAQDLAEALAGSGASVSNVSFIGDPNAGGTFTSDAATIGIDSGVVLGTGNVTNVSGPNSTDFTSRANGRVGDGDINALTGPQSGDAASLRFDFVPTGDGVSFNFVFSSEEYSEFVGSEFNDTVALFINGENCALVADDPISVNTINLNNNALLYRDNEFDEDSSSPIDTEMDGLTTVLTCQAQVLPGQTNKFKLVIADVSNNAIPPLPPPPDPENPPPPPPPDLNRDSNVFVAPGAWTGGPGQPPTCVEDGLQLLDGTGVASGIVHDQLEPVIGQILPELQAAVHDVNCGVVVPLEDAIDGAG